MMTLLKCGSYGHHIQCVVPGCYRISWVIDNKYGHIRFPRLFSRNTDERGARRFAKRWGCRLPGDIK